MYKLFNEVSGNHGMVFGYPKMDYIQSVLGLSVKRLVDYRREYVGFVDSDHLLVKVLYALTIPYTGDDVRYVATVEQRMAEFSGLLHFTSAAFKGRVHYPGVLYGKEAYEVLIASDEEFPIAGFAQHWQDARPIRILSHYRTDLSVETLDGKSETNGAGAVVAVVNIPMLALQYQHWRKSPYAGVGEVKKGMREFLFAYPLTNAIYSHLDVAILNRLLALYAGKPTTDSRRRLPFYTTSVEREIDYVLNQCINNITKTKMDFEDILRNIPMFDQPSALQVIQTRKIPYTQQVVWALIAARIDVTGLLLRVGAETNNERNTAEITQITRSLIQAKSSKVLEIGMAPVFSQFIRRKIDLDIMPYL